MLHNYSTDSKLSREGKCRQVGYMDKAVPEVRFAPNVSDDLVLVYVPALAEAFFLAWINSSSICSKIRRKLLLLSNA